MVAPPVRAHFYPHLRQESGEIVCVTFVSSVYGAFRPALSSELACREFIERVEEPQAGPGPAF